MTVSEEGSETFNVLDRTVTEDSFTQTLLERLASVEDCEEHQLDFVLHEYIDGEALDSLLESGDSDLKIRLRIEAYEILLAGDGTIVIAERNQYPTDETSE